MASISINMAVFGSLVFPIRQDSQEKTRDDTPDKGYQKSITGTNDNTDKVNCVQKYTETLKLIHRKLGISLFEQRLFSLFCFAMFLSVKGIIVPKVFLLDVTTDKGIGNQHASFLISIMGIADLIW